MDMKRLVNDLMAPAIGRKVLEYLEEDGKLPYQELAKEAALQCLAEIGEAVQSDKDDFEVVEEIVVILHKYNISTGGRHDF